MDLNIGTAFWFASRGMGYLCAAPAYGEDELRRVMGSTIGEGLRPVLRHGAGGAAAGVGRSRRIEEEGEEEEEEGDGAVATAAAEKEKEEEEGEQKRCMHPQCRRVRKRGCPHRLCKRCCCKRDHQHHHHQHDSSSSDIIISSSSASCPVHRSKAKHILPPHSTAPTADYPPPSPPLSLPTSPSPPPPPISIIPYRSTCKALLVGIGADEQMAGELGSAAADDDI